MDIISILVSGFVGLLTLVVLYVVFASRHYMIFKRLGIKMLTPWPAVGSYPEFGKLGLTGFYNAMYKQFESEKAYGYFEGSTPVLVVKDLDMLREITVKSFNCFVNRRGFPTQEPFNHALTRLQDDHWRHVRNTVSPTFSSGKLKKMCLLVEQTAKSLTSNLREACREDKEIELKHVIGCYTMDVIAQGLGSRFVTEAKNMMNFGKGFVSLLILFPFLLKILAKFGIGIFSKESIDFFNSFLDAAMENRSGDNEAKTTTTTKSQKRYDFVQLMIEESKRNESATTENDGSRSTSAEGKQQARKGLTRLDIQGQAIIFILAGYDTVSSVLSFAFFILAHNHDCMNKLQEELDEILAGQPPNYDNVQDLLYLDRCLNETMRLYPPGFIINRMCTQDCEVEGVKIPKGMAIVIPFIAIFKDPNIFPDPEKFDPERFTSENKASRHPYAFLPFGQGPRNCIGMRLALMEMKIAMAAILQEMTPVSCSKSVYPPRLSKYRMNAEDGLWVKFIPRNKQ